MPPAIARAAIATYSQPGGTVLDPMCGIGTVPIEAIDAGRRGYGVDYEPEWVATTTANLHLARGRHIRAEGAVWQGDARQLATVLPEYLRGKVDLVVTSPPYGSQTHGYWPAGRAEKILRTNDRYSTRPRDRTQLAHHNLTGLCDGISDILSQCARLLKPGGILVLTARPWIQRARLVDFPGILTDLALSTGQGVCVFRLDTASLRALAKRRDNIIIDDRRRWHRRSRIQQI